MRRFIPPIFTASSIHPVPDGSQREKPPALADVLRARGQRPKLGQIFLSQISPPKAWRESSCANLNQRSPDSQFHFDFS